MKAILFALTASIASFVSVAAEAAGASYGGPSGGGYKPAQIQAPGQFNGGAINIPSRAAPAPIVQPVPVVRPPRR